MRHYTAAQAEEMEMLLSSLVRASEVKLLEEQLFLG